MTGPLRRRMQRSAAAPRRGGIIGIVLFAVVVLGISALLVRARPTLSSAEPAPSALGDETAIGLTPITRSSRLPGGDRDGVRVALLRDPASESYYEDSLEYDRLLDGWASMLAATGATVQRITPDAVAADTSAVLVVAGAPCLSNAARAAMRQVGARPRGVIFTGLTGVRDGGCRHIGWGLVADLVGAARADTLPAREDRYITIPAGSALGIDIPPGARVELRPAPSVVVRHRSRDVYYSDRDLNPLISGSADLLDGAVAHDLGSGRPAVYFGFELTTVVDRPWDRAIAMLLVRNAVALAAGIPLAAPDAWPGGASAAAVIAQDVEDEFANAGPTVDTLRAAGATGTFFVVSDLAKGHAALTREMAQVGEVGTHSENHVRLGGSVEMQRERLARTQSDLTALLGRPIRGMRPPEERFDPGTLLAWKQAGGTYVFAANDGRSPSPEIVEVGGTPSILIGRTVDDDFLTVRRMQIVEPGQLARDQLEAFEKVRALGGLYVMSYHSNMLARGSSIGALGIVARALRADTTIWLTTAGDVADWWLLRHRMSATATRDGDGMLSLTIRNTADGPSPAASVTVTLPNGAHATAASEADLIESRAGLARVRVPPLVANGSFTTRLTLAGGHDRVR